jgi:hypothetical protein
MSKQWSTREKWDKLLPQTHSPEVDYSLFMAVMMVLTSERMEKHPGRLRQRFPLQSSLEQPLFLCFMFLYCLFRDHQGGLYIGIFRSSWASGDKDGQHRRSEPQTRLGGAAWHTPHVSFGPRGQPCWLLCALGASHGKILMIQKFWVNLSSGRFLKLINMQNRVFLSYRVITKIRGINGKSP